MSMSKIVEPKHCIPMSLLGRRYLHLAEIPDIVHQQSEQQELLRSKEQIS
jgi:hypothetical protein